MILFQSAWFAAVLCRNPHPGTAGRFHELRGIDEHTARHDDRRYRTDRSLWYAEK